MSTTRFAFLLITVLFNISNVLCATKSSITTVTIQSTNTPTAASVTNTVPYLKYSCSSDGKIGNIVPDKNKVFLVENGQYCRLSNSSCIWKGKETIHVLYNPNENNTEIIGGKSAYFYELTCIGLQGFDLSANSSFEIQSVTPTAGEKKETVTASTPSKTLTLTIKDNNQKIVSNGVKIGDELSLEMTGPKDYYVFPKECIAYSGDKTGTHYTLWKNGTCKSSDPAVLEDKWTINTTSTIKMYAFRFVASSKILIECSAHMCPKSNTNCISAYDCSKAFNTTSGGNVGRKRRDLASQVGTSGMEDSASATFTVVDGTVTPNGAPSSHVTIVQTVVMVAVTMMTFGRSL